jgi:hypothetical protein
MCDFVYEIVWIVRDDPLQSQAARVEAALGQQAPQCVDALLSVTVAVDVMAIARGAGSHKDPIGAAEKSPQEVCGIEAS